MRRRYGYQQVVFEATGLGAGSHTLQVINTGTKNPSSSGTYLDIDAVEAENVVAPVAVSRFENTDAGLVFSSPGWWVSTSCAAFWWFVDDDGGVGCVVECGV